jgi:hypothetical protein
VVRGSALDTSYGTRLIFTELPKQVDTSLRISAGVRCTNFTLPSGRHAEEHVFADGAKPESTCACTKYTLAAGRNW